MTTITRPNSAGVIETVVVPDEFFGTSNPDSAIVVPNGFQLIRARKGRKIIRVLAPIGGNLPALPNGFVFLIDADNLYLTDDDGAYLLVEA